MKKDLFGYCALTLLFWFSIYAYQSNFAPYLAFLNASPTMAGLIIGSYGVTQFLARLPFGLLGDQKKCHKRIILCCLGAGFLSSLLLFTSDHLAVTLLARAGAGVTASAWVNIMVLFSNRFKPAEAVKAVGLLSFFNNAGQICGMLFGSWTVDAAADAWGMRAGYKSAFALSMAVTAACLIPALWVRDGSAASSGLSLAKIKAVLTDRRLLSVSFIAIILQFITFGTTFGFLTQYATEVLASTPAQNGLLTVVPYIPTAVGAMALAQLLAERVKERRLICGGMVLMALFTFLTPLTDNFIALMAVQTMVGLGRGISFPLLMGLAIRHITPERRGTAMGLFQSLYALGILGGPVFVGIIGDAVSLSHAFFLCGGACLLMTAAAYRLLREKKGVS